MCEFFPHKNLGCCLMDSFTYCKIQNIPIFGLRLQNLCNLMVVWLNQLTSDRTLDVLAENPIYASVAEENVSYHITSILEVIHCVHIGQTCPDVFWNSHCFLAFVFVWQLTKDVFCILYVLEIKFLCQTSLNLSRALE